MLAELGHFALILALLSAIAVAGLVFAGLRAGDPVTLGLARAGAVTQFALSGFAFIVLCILFATSDFSVALVADNSHTLKPFIYKLTGVWGNHEGSLALWVLIMTGYTAALALTAQRADRQLISATIGVQSLTTAGFLAFLLFTSNPFARVWPAPQDGADLNPLLQDPGLASHPPLLYAGYVGFSIVFSFAAAALILGRADARWARVVRPWALSAWVFLTIGITLGANWAYYELGWGGWWAWDPVENASLLPWLTGAALIHSLRVMEKRDTLKSWTILLALLTFSLSLLGTFLVRSGVITSVHAFAVDPTRGVFILGLLGAAIGGSFILYALRAPILKPTGSFKPVSRESLLLINNVVLAVSCAVVLYGTYYELFVRVSSEDRITVQAPFFNMTFNPIVGALLVLLPLSGLIAWKRGQLRPALTTLAPAAGLAVIAFLVSLFAIDGSEMAGALGVALAVWIGAGVLADLAKRVKLFSAPVAQSLSRLRHLPASLWGMTVSHFGVAILIFGIAGVSAFNTDRPVFMQEGESTRFAGFDITLSGVERVVAENYVADAAQLSIVRNGREIDRLVAERRFYPVRGMQTTEAAIRATMLGDLYITIGARDEARGWPVQLRRFPLAVWLWMGGALIALGGAVALSDRGRRRLSVHKTAGMEAKPAE